MNSPYKVQSERGVLFMETKKTIKYYIHVAVMLFFFFGFGHIPSIGLITDIGMQILGVFIGLIWGWMFIDMLWPSLLGMIALGMTDYSANVVSVFASGFGNKNVILVFLFFIFSQYLEHSGLSRTVAYKLLTLKIVTGKPWCLCFMLFLAAYILGVVINTYAVIFLLWTIVYDLCLIAGYKKGDSIAGCLLVGIVYIAGISGTVMPYQVFPSVCMNALEETTGLAVDTDSFIFFNLVVSFLGVVAYFLVCKFLLKIDISKLKSVSKEQLLNDLNVEIKYDNNQKIATAILCIFLVLILVPGFLSDQNILKVFYKKIGDQGLLALMMCIVCAIKIKEQGLADIAKLINNGVNWSLMFLLMATFTIGDAVNSDAAGIIAQVSVILTPLFNNMSSIVFLVASFVMLGVITQVAHNLVLAAVFVPLLSSLAISSGLGESIAIIVSMGLAVVLLQALVTPAASNRGALNFGSDWIGKNNALKFGLVAVLTADLVVILIGIPLGMLMF